MVGDICLHSFNTCCTNLLDAICLMGAVPCSKESARVESAAQLSCHNFPTVKGVPEH